MTTRQTLDPVQQPRTGSNAPLDVTAGLTAGALTAGAAGVQFANTETEVLKVSVGTGPVTATVNIGTEVEGKTVPGLQFDLPTTGHVYELGPFPLDEDQSGGDITVDFDTPANVAGVLLVQNVGA